MKRAGAGIALVIAAAGCSVTDPNEPSFSFEVTRAAVAPEAPRLVVSGREGGVRVEGDTWTACSGGTLTASLARPSADGLALVITDRQAGDVCADQPVAHSYRALLGRLEPGRYHLQILLRHSHGRTPPRTVFHDFVHVQ